MQINSINNAVSWSIKNFQNYEDSNMVGISTALLGDMMKLSILGSPATQIEVVLWRLQLLEKWLLHCESWKMYGLVTSCILDHRIMRYLLAIFGILLWGKRKGNILGFRRSWIYSWRIWGICWVLQFFVTILWFRCENRWKEVNSDSTK